MAHVVANDFANQPLNEEDESRYETNQNYSSNQHIGGSVF